jgi:hypothetical protein
MAIIMEATSLSSITNIACNPPASPAQGASDFPLQPLILYIARVPGSQDVFLTTLKPREKVISAEDIQNSLYYVHVSRQEDLDKIDDEQSPVQVDSPVLSYAPVMQDGRIVRKPAPPPRPMSTSGPPQSPTDHNGAEIRIARRPVGASRPLSQPPQADLPVLAAKPRRPLPAIPQDDILPASQLSGHGFGRPANPKSVNNENLNGFYPHSNSSSEQTSISSNDNFGSLTLIRRDPVSCEQWNVANISDSLSLPGLNTQAGNVSRRFHCDDRKTRAPLDITILNSSYQQFLSSDNQQLKPHTHNSHLMISPDGIFRRQVHPSHTSPLHAKESRSSQHADIRPASSISPTPDFSTTDTQKRHFLRRSADISFSRKPLSSSSPSSGGVYNFLSPWGTLCEFTPSKIGSNLKCRYRVPHDPYNSPIELSELRFNLPNSNNKSSIRPHSAAAHPYRPNSSLSSLSASTNPDTYNTRNNDYSDDEYDEEMRIFQNLGSEKAGGGFGGKKAKLGKLIIYPHGVEMLDLLVAANVGLWWRAWEKAG